MKRILSVILTCSLVMGILFFDMPVSSADEFSVDTTDLLNILNQYYSDLSDSVIEDIVSETPYFLFRDITVVSGVHHYQLDTFSVNDLMLWHYQYDGRNLKFYQYVTNPAWYSFDYINPSGLVGYTIYRYKDTNGSFSDSFYQRFVYNGNNGVVTPSQDSNYNTSVYWYTFTSPSVSGALPWRLNYEDITRILYTCSNVDCANTGFCQFESVIDDNFTDISIVGSVSDPALNISWAESIYNTSYTYGYSEIQLGIMFDNTITYVSFDSLDYPDYFPNGSNIYIPFDFIISISDISPNIDSFSRVKLGEIILNQYAKFNPGDSLYAKFSSYSLANLILFPLGGATYDDFYVLDDSANSYYSGRTNNNYSINYSSYDYDYQTFDVGASFEETVSVGSGRTFNVDNSVPTPYFRSAVLVYSAYYDNSNDAVDEFIDNVSFRVGDYSESLVVTHSWERGIYSSPVIISYGDGSLDSRDALLSDVDSIASGYLDYFDLVVIANYTPNDSTHIIYSAYLSPHLYEKLHNYEMVDIMTSQSSQLSNICKALYNDYNLSDNLFSYLKYRLDDMELNQINYFGTSTGLFNDLNDSITVIDVHLGDIVTYLSTIDDRLLSIDTSLASTLSVADSAVLSLLGDILTAIGNIETGGGDVTVTDEESPYTFQVFFPYLEAFEGDSDSASVSDNLLPDNVKGFLDRHYQTIYSVYSGIFGSLYRVMDIDETGNLDTNEMGTYKLAIDKFFNAVNLTYIDRSIEYSTGDNMPVNYYPDGFSRILRVSFDLTTMDGGQ